MDQFLIGTIIRSTVNYYFITGHDDTNMFMGESIVTDIFVEI